MKKIARNMGFALGFAAIVGGWAIFALNKSHPAPVNTAVEVITASLQDLDGTAVVERVRESGIPGLKEVFVRTQSGGDEVVYVSEDGRKLLYGEMVDLGTRSSDTRAAVIGRRMDLIKAAAAQGAIRYAGPSVTKTAYVFVDPSSEFSRLLHRDLAQLNEAGLAIEYLAFPREGSAGTGFRQLARIWCADDRSAALDGAMLGRDLVGKECTDTVASHLALGRRLGVDGTPVFVTDDGRQFPGYPSAAKLLETFGMVQPGSSASAAPSPTAVVDRAAPPQAAPPSSWVPAGKAGQGG